MNQIPELLKELRPDVDFTSSTDFIEDYLLDSFDIMMLTAELEGKFNIKIPTETIIPENYQSFETIANLVQMCGGRV